MLALKITQILKIKLQLISPQFEQRWSSLDKPPGQMAVAQLEAGGGAGESWERIKKKLLEEANRAVRAFRVNRDSGAMVNVWWAWCIMPELLTSPRTAVVRVQTQLRSGESEKKLSESLPPR